MNMEIKTSETEKSIKYLLLVVILCVVTITMTIIIYNQLSEYGNYDHDYKIGISLVLSLTSAVIITSLISPLIKTIKVIK